MRAADPPRLDPYAGCWALPGGHVDAGEHTVAAARRELAEETGLDVHGLDLVGVYAAPGRDPRGRYVTFAYTTTLPSPLPAPIAGDDATEASWWPISELVDERAPMAFDHHQILAEALATAASPLPTSPPPTSPTGQPAARAERSPS